MSTKRFGTGTAALVMLGVIGPALSVRSAGMQPPVPSPSTVRDPLASITSSNDIGWLQALATSADRAAELATAPPGRVRPREIREAAYVRLGAIGTSASVAAIVAIEATLANTRLTPATVNVDVWPMAPNHYQESTVPPLVESIAPDGTTYRIVYWHLLGPLSLFVTSSATPARRDSWSRPLLIDHEAAAWPRDAMLEWKDRQTAILRYTPDRTGSRVEVPIPLSALRRDSDGDEWTDIEERRLGLDPRRADTDGDGLPDGRDTCPLLSKSAPPDDLAPAIQRVFVVRFGFSGSRDAIFVRPNAVPVHLFGYGGPVLFGRDIPSDHNGRGATYVTWQVVSRSAAELVIEMSDWKGVLGGAGGRYVVQRIEGQWVVVAFLGGWIS